MRNTALLLLCVFDLSVYLTLNSLGRSNIMVAGGNVQDQK